MQRPVLLLTFSLILAAVSLAAQGRSFSGAATEPTPAKQSQANTLAQNTAPAATVLCQGRVSTAGGALPGAVVRLLGTNEMTATNADGEFTFTLPATSGPVQASITYAGFADETATLAAGAGIVRVLLLVPVAVAKVDKQHQLKAYLKTSRKQVKRNLAQVRKTRHRNA